MEARALFRVGLALNSSALGPQPSTANYNIETSRVEGFSLQRGRSNERSEIQPGALSLRLRNHDGRFTVANGAGPYTGHLRPGRSVFIKAAPVDGAYYGEADIGLDCYGASTDYSYVWRGYLTDIPTKYRNDDPFIDIKAVDGLARLSLGNMVAAPNATWGSTDIISNAITHANGGFVTTRELTGGSLSQTTNSLTTGAPMARIRQVVESEGNAAIFYYSKAGVAVFRGSTHRQIDTASNLPHFTRGSLVDFSENMSDRDQFSAVVVHGASNPASAVDTTAQTNYGPTEWRISAPMRTSNQASALAVFLLGKYADYVSGLGAVRPRVKLSAMSKGTICQMLGRDLDDPIQIDIDTSTGVAGGPAATVANLWAFIDGIDLSVGPNGTEISAEWQLSRAELYSGF